VQELLELEIAREEKLALEEREFTAAAGGEPTENTKKIATSPSRRTPVHRLQQSFSRPAISRNEPSLILQERL